jgi:hypothetical protein
MPFDWNNFLVLAEELSTRVDEASKRTAISRAYYFVFHLAFARAESTAGHFPGGGNSHQWCWDKYQITAANTRDRLSDQIWLLGDRMKRRRNKADYNDDMPRLVDDLNRTLEEARRFPAELAALDPRYPLP